MRPDPQPARLEAALEVSRARIQNGPSNGERDRRHDVGCRTTISDSFIGDHGIGIMAVVTGLATSNISLSIDRTTIVDNVGMGLFARRHVGTHHAVVNLANSTDRRETMWVSCRQSGGGYIRDDSGTQINGNDHGIDTVRDRCDRDARYEHALRQRHERHVHRVALAELSAVQRMRRSGVGLQRRRWAAGRRSCGGAARIGCRAQHPRP